MDNNVTTAHLKNLVTYKPAPITVKLAQSQSKWALMDDNVTTAHLKNLVTDKPAPITTKLAQTHGNDFALMDNNVTIAHLKNLVTDKPAPITTKLAQVHGNDFALMDNNVTIGHLKNLVTDKPAPITVKLAQIEKDDKMKNLVASNTTTNAPQALAQGVPVHVNPVIMKDTMGDAKLDLHILVGPDEVELKKKQAAAKQSLG